MKYSLKKVKTGVMLSNKLIKTNIFYFLILNILNFIDLVTTKIGLKLGLRELNPVFHVMEQKFYIFKILFVLALSGFYLWFAKFYSEKNYIKFLRAYRITIIIFALVIFSNCIGIYLKL